MKIVTLYFTNCRVNGDYFFLYTASQPWLCVTSVYPLSLEHFDYRVLRLPTECEEVGVQQFLNDYFTWKQVHGLTTPDWEVGEYYVKFIVTPDVLEIKELYREAIADSEAVIITGPFSCRTAKD